jgi:hypothetical protein
VQKAFKGSIPWQGEFYDVTYEFDTRDAERKSTLIRAQDMSNDIAMAFATGKVDLAIRVLRLNLLAYDGQNFFDSDHVHPDDTPYSNIVTAARVDDAAPDVYEARAEFKLAIGRLQRNRLIRNSIAKVSFVKDSILVVAKSDAVLAAYDSLLNEERIDGDPNRFRGSFQLFRDFKPEAGTEDSVDFIWSEPNGPRPALIVNTREPNGLQFDESKAFSHHRIPFGMDAEYAIAAGFPQTAVRFTPA